MFSEETCEGSRVAGGGTRTRCGFKSVAPAWSDKELLSENCPAEFVLPKDKEDGLLVVTHLSITGQGLSPEG